MPKMLPLLFCLCLAAPILATDSKCVKSRFVLECNNAALEELPSYYIDEQLLVLTNITGENSWNSTVFNRINSVTGENVDFKSDAVDDLLKIPELSSLDLKWSKIELSAESSSTIFTVPNLRKLVLTGSLQHPPPIFNFSYLSELDLSHNLFLEVPDIIGEKLVFLNLSSTKIQQVDNLNKLKSLEELDLSNNQLREIKNDSFAFNEDLTKLWLQSNDLTAVYFNASELIFLDLNYNRIGTVKGDYFKGLPSLTTIYLVENEIEIMIEPFKYVPLLKILDLSYNNLENLEGSWFESILELEVLKLSHNNLKELPILKKPMMNLHHLNLSRNVLETLDHHFFDKTPSLAVLDVTGNQLKTIDNAMVYLKKLNKLHIAHNYLVIRDTTFSAAEMLNFLNLSYNSLMDMTLSDLENNLMLKDVDLSHNNLKELCVGGAAPSQIKNLDISYNQVESLKCLKSLDSLNVVGNPLLCSKQLQTTIQKLLNESVYISLPSNNLVESINVTDESTIYRRLSSQWEAVFKTLCPNGIRVEIDEKIEDASLETTSSDKNEPEPMVPFYNDKFDEISDDDSEDEMDDDSEDDDSYTMDNDFTMQSQKPSIASLDNILKNKNTHRAFMPWAKWAFVLLAVSAVLLLINLGMFIWYKKRARTEARLGCDNPYEQLRNEVYKGTTLPMDSRRPATIGRVMSNLKSEKLGEILNKFGFKPKNVAADAESQARMIPGNQCA